MKKIAGLIFINILIPVWIWNHSIFLLINTHHNAVADQIFGVIADLGDFKITLLLILLLILFQLRLGLAALLTYTIAVGSNQILKHLFDMPRPPAVFENIHILGDVLTTQSFPSAHATFSGVCTYLSFLLWRDKPKLVSISVLLFLMAAYGRVYGGVHFPIDVLVGFALGVLMMYWADKISECWNMSLWQGKAWLWWLPAITTTLVSIYIFTTHDIQPSTARAITQVLPFFALVLVLQSWQKRTH